MKRILTGMVVFTVYWLTGLSQPAQAADLHFEQPDVEIGEVRSGPALVQRFAFINRGPEAIEITNLRVECGCMTPRLDQRRYQAGEQAELLLEVNTLTQAAGGHSWPVQLTYLDAAGDHELTVQLRATLLTEVTVQPAAMTIFADRAVHHEIILTDLRATGLNVTAARTSSPNLQAFRSEQGRDAEGHWVRKITLEVASAYSEGRHDESVILCTDDPLYRELKVPVTIIKRVRQQLSALPNQVTLTAPLGQPLPSRIVLVRDREDRPVVVERIDTDDAALTCRWAQGPGAAATLKISAERGQIHGVSMNSAIHVRISKPIAETVTIPVSCLLR